MIEKVKLMVKDPLAAAKEDLSKKGVLGLVDDHEKS